jgi:hypothetical protein
MRAYYQKEKDSKKIMFFCNKTTIRKTVTDRMGQQMTDVSQGYITDSLDDMENKGYVTIGGKRSMVQDVNGNPIKSGNSKRGIVYYEYTFETT